MKKIEMLKGLLKNRKNKKVELKRYNRILKKNLIERYYNNKDVNKFIIIASSTACNYTTNKNR